jgi:hypothetical protein
MAKEMICKNCGKRFRPWRAKQYCSERCRKQAENRRRLRGDETDSGAGVADDQKLEKISKQDQSLADVVRGYEWSAINEVTHKLAPPGGSAVGWAIYIERQKGWFGRVRDDMSFGPTSLRRARESVDAFLRMEPFEKREGERSWRGNCSGLL